MTEELQKRVLTGVVGAAVLVGLILFGGWVGICLLATILSLAMVHEFAGMVFEQQDAQEKRYALLCLAWIVGMANMIFSKSQFELTVFCFLALFGYYLLTAERHNDETFFGHFKELMYSLFGVIYLIMMPTYLTDIHASVSGVKWTMLFFFIVWADDVVAYFVGKRFGRHKLYPLISPKKSIEGAEGGLIGGVVITILYKLLIFHELHWLGAFFIPLIVGIASQVGDLCESFLKRAYGKKDSGSILPGHGGFLDRFDGVVFSLPVMYACIRIFQG
ncbi:MAG: phosphatidate cytidylyltransferase [Oligoflexia bacterium]|nr:phosphatidate cytidylyltransferase [Oligoflexia bacterium]